MARLGGQDSGDVGVQRGSTNNDSDVRLNQGHEGKWRQCQLELHVIRTNCELVHSLAITGLTSDTV